MGREYSVTIQVSSKLDGITPLLAPLLLEGQDVRESVQVEAAGIPAAGNDAVSGEHVPEIKARASTSAHFSEREAWLVGVIAQGVKHGQDLPALRHFW
jgi:hypothetical protein